MSARTTAAKRVPNVVYLLAEHLDAGLAAGEDLAALSLAVPHGSGPRDGDAIAKDIADLKEFVARIASLELRLIGRVMEARKRSVEVRRADVRFKPIAGLFEGGTAALVDAVEALGRGCEHAFHSGGCPFAFLRERGLIAADAPGLAGIETLAITDTLRVAGRIELGPLLDLVATFLDTLEIHYALFEAAGGTAGGGGDEEADEPREAVPDTVATAG